MRGAFLIVKKVNVIMITLFDILSENSAQNVLNPPQQLYLSISSHLLKLLNTRRGSLVHLPDYGIPDLAEIYQDLPYSVNRLVQAIKHTIEKYEPRLTNVKVMQKPVFDSECVLHLEIQAQAIAGYKILFNTFFTHCGAKIENC